MVSAKKGLASDGNGRQLGGIDELHLSQRLGRALGENALLKTFRADRATEPLYLGFV